MWVILATIGAFAQAVQMAINKKALRISGIKNFIAAFSFLSGGIFLILIYLWEEKSIWPENGLSSTFWYWMLWTVIINVLSVWFLYKALQLAELNYLMPFMTLTSLSIIIPPIILLGEIPSAIGFLGITIVATGAFLIDYKKKKKQASKEDEEREKNNRLGKLYFLGTAIGYTISPTTTKLAIVQSSGQFVALASSVLLGLAFMVFIFIFREQKRIKNLFENFSKKKVAEFLLVLVLLGIIATISNWTINVALESANVSYVFAIKRIMPLFAFLIGYFYFRERRNISRKIIATCLMVAGAIITTLS